MPTASRLPDLQVGTAEQVEALLPGPDLAVRSRAAFAWQDELMAELLPSTGRQDSVS